MNVTIVIPIYKDWQTIKLCILSLIKYAPENVPILLINDCSEDADDLEISIKSAIINQNQFVYVRNPKNLGFVKTCNRAVFELDQTNNDILLLNSDTEVTENFLEEMYAILHSQNQHGVVCPRSSNATLLTFPTFEMKETNGFSNKEHLELFKKTSAELPRFHVIPTGVGFCMLIKRSLIINLGLFDEIYDKGYHEENDFCMRISQYGYSIICANHALVFHYESKSFGKNERVRRDKENNKILIERYPYYPELIHNYFKNGKPVIETFVPTLVGKPKLLFCLYEAKPHFDGTTIYGLKLLEAFNELFHDTYEITVLAHKSAIDFHKLESLYSRLIEPHQLKSKYSIVFSPSQMFNWEHLKIHLQYGLKSIFTLQDIIVLRCPQLISEKQPLKRIFQYALKYADGIITISNFVKRDVIAYFNNENIDKVESKTTTIYHGINPKSENIERSNIEHVSPFEKYVLVIGNQFTHKSMNLTYEVLHKAKTQINYVFLGLKPTFQYSSNFQFIASGNLSSEYIFQLYAQSDAIVFPSQYEGFGLPIIESLSHGKHLFIFKNEINSEVLSSTNLTEYLNVTFFEHFNDLSDLIVEKMDNTKLRQPFTYRSWVDVAKETEIFIHKTLALPINKELIEDRNLLLNSFFDINSSLVSHPTFLSDNLRAYNKIKKIATNLQLIRLYKMLKYLKGKWNIYSS
jgi:GT2 family glycosyltransferase/glycosyltransferase involved in cell wall biosynthesis